MANISTISEKTITELINSAKLTYISETSWSYLSETLNFVVEFYQDESGKNNIEQFCKRVNKYWIELTPTDAQIKLMFNKLNATPYEPQERFDYIDECWENGHKPSDFF